MSAPTSAEADLLVVRGRIRNAVAELRAAADAIARHDSKTADLLRFDADLVEAAHLTESNR